jgi:hypothetical protein
MLTTAGFGTVFVSAFVCQLNLFVAICLHYGFVMMCCRSDIVSPGEMQRLSFIRLFYHCPSFAGQLLSNVYNLIVFRSSFDWF